MAMADSKLWDSKYWAMFIMFLSVVVISTTAATIYYNSHALYIAKQLYQVVAPGNFIRYGAIASIIAGSIGVIAGGLNFFFPYRTGDHFLVSSWSISAVIVGIAFMLEYISSYTSSTIPFTSSTSLLSAGHYSPGSCFCQANGNPYFPRYVKMLPYADLCKEDVAARVLIVVLFVFSIGMCCMNAWRMWAKQREMSSAADSEKVEPEE